MKRLLIITAIATSLIGGCSSSPDQAFVNKEKFQENNRPFLTPYQTSHSQTTMVELDKTNDQVEIHGGSEYVFWTHDYPSALTALNNSKPVIVEEKKEFPFTIDKYMSNSKPSVTPKKKDAIIYDIGECESKGCEKE